MNRLALRDFTSARVEIGRTGHSLKTAALLALRLAHAQARDAVHKALNTGEIVRRLDPGHSDCLLTRSAAPDRMAYLHRPDLGRRLSEESGNLVRSHRGDYDLVFVVADGLSALAAERHAVPMIDLLAAALGKADWRIAPVVIAEQARVAIGDDIGDLVGAKQSLVLIGERPGMSTPDSLGAYLTWGPKPGLSDASRNCVSNIREGGLRYEEAAHKLIFLLTEAKLRKLSGVPLKEDAQQLSQPASGSLLESAERD